MSHHHIIVFAFGSNALKSELGNTDVPNSELSRMHHNICIENKLGYLLLSKTMIVTIQ